MEGIIDIKDFSAGVFRKQYQYKNFLPSLINHEWQISNIEINHLLSEADRKIGELNAFSQLIPDIDFFITMHIYKEATESSRIEGTQTTLGEAFIDEENLAEEKRNDQKEVRNYIASMNRAIDSLVKLPLSNRLLGETHKILMSNVRGKNKNPGEFRKSQNWIGATLKDAVYIPPLHEEVPELMSDLERFLHNERLYVPHLIKIAIAHYQFETIHPFLDGNGRIGRLMIALYLVSTELLKKPALYLSDYFERHKQHYYDYLTRVRTHNDLTQWIKFFLSGVIETSNSSIGTFHSILSLKEKVEHHGVPSLGKKAKKALELVKFLYKEPIMSAMRIQTLLNITPATTYSLINDFERIGILKELTGSKRNRIYVFEDYLNIFDATRHS